MIPINHSSGASFQKGASADEAVIPWKGSLPQILALAAHFVFAVLALDVVVAEELLLQADILTGPLAVSCSAQKVILLHTVTTIWTFVGLVALSIIKTVTIFAFTLFSRSQGAVDLIFFSFTMNDPVTLVLVLDAHTLVLPDAVIESYRASCSARQIISTISTLSQLNRVATVHAIVFK